MRAGPMKIRRATIEVVAWCAGCHWERTPEAGQRMLRATRDAAYRHARRYGHRVKLEVTTSTDYEARQ